MSQWEASIKRTKLWLTPFSDQPHDGNKCLKLHYRFVGAGQFQYLGLPNKVKIQAPVHKLHFWLKGDNSKCSYGLQVGDASGETHQYRSLSTNKGQGGIIDFAGWKEVVFDLDAPHETWGGDKNGGIDYPITAIIFTLGQPTENDKLLPAESDLFIIEAYGGEGPREPNAFDTYMICPHAWDQGETGKAIEKKAFEGLHNPIRMGKFGIPSAWFETFHI